MNSKTRFSNRVEHYIKYRPTYPVEAISFILSQFNIHHDTVIADIGSGTGILTQLLANYTSTIFAVEPNNEMRNAAELLLNDNKSFKSINGSSESTTLNDNSIDLITVAQAFHWFDLDKTKIEFKRILKPNGIVMLIWNNRLINTEFLIKYDFVLKKYANDYNEVNHQNITIDTLKTFFANGMVNQKSFPNTQRLDLNGLKGRLLSSSYAPIPGDYNYPIITSELEKLFGTYNRDGLERFTNE